LNILAVIFRSAAWLLTVLYVLALVVFIVGNFGLFGFDKDPLSAVYLLVLGWPWLVLTEDLPERLLMVSALIAPLINIVILQSLGSLLGRRRRP
jgi:hypothetical protein